MDIRLCAKFCRNFGLLWHSLEMERTIQLSVSNWILGGMIYLITWGFGLHDFRPLAFVKNMVYFLSGVNWFFYAYLGLYMFAPVLNAFIEKVDEKQMMWMTFAFFAFQTVFGWILKQGEFYYGLTFTSLIG